jgi:SAM-dependent methyltransferase
MACSCCSPGTATARHFDAGRVRQELESYRSSGPAITARGLLGLLRGVAPPPESVLDIGSGFGALSLELLRTGTRHATCVDLSAAALAANAEEASRQGMGDRIERVEGDFVAVAATLPPAQLVTLDRVVCCYPDYQPLLAEAAAHSDHLLAMSYPRNRWWVRLGVWAENLWLWLRGDPFRAFLHSPAEMARLLRDRGFTLTRTAATFTWQMDLYTRHPAVTP